MEHTSRGSDRVRTTSTVTTPFATPWRAVVTGSTHAELADNAQLVLYGWVELLTREPERARELLHDRLRLERQRSADTLWGVGDED